jgi:hypothetical protein
MEKIAPAVDAGLLTVPTAAIEAIDRCLAPIENNFKLYSLSEDYAATDVVRFWRANVKELIRSFNESKDAIDELSEIAALNNLADFFNTFNVKMPCLVCKGTCSDFNNYMHFYISKK